MRIKAICQHKAGVPQNACLAPGANWRDSTSPNGFSPTGALTRPPNSCSPSQTLNRARPLRI